MKTTFIISLFITLCAVLASGTPAHAQKKDTAAPATHMWMKTGTSSMNFIPVRSLEECEMLAGQAAILNSAEAACFNGKILLKKVACTKPTSQNATPTCK